MPAGVFIRGPFSRCLLGASPPWRPRVRCRFSCWVAGMCCPRMDVLCAYLEAVFNFCASPCPHVCDVLTVASILAEWRITTTDTSCSAMHISPIQRCTSPSSGTPNWVSCRAPLPASIFLRSQSSCCCVVDFDVPALLLTRRGCSVRAGQLLWRRFDSSRIPSHHSLRAACMQLLPLVEMFCKWELQEDCSNLGELVRRFDSEAELQSHNLGRSMLQMVRDDGAGLHQLPPRPHSSPSPNPFDAIRTTLAACDTALQGMQPQVHVGLDVPPLVRGHRCCSCRGASQSACSLCGLCPFTFNARLCSPATMLYLCSLPSRSPRHVVVCTRYVCASITAPVNPFTEPSNPPSCMFASLQHVRTVLCLSLACRPCKYTPVPSPWLPSLCLQYSQFFVVFCNSTSMFAFAAARTISACQCLVCTPAAAAGSSVCGFQP